jgi:peptidoglycan L-alanyl-D-glutamate endopeptidase CwlK
MAWPAVMKASGHSLPPRPVGGIFLTLNWMDDSMLQHLERLQEVHPDLARVVRRAEEILSERHALDMLVVEGLRSKARQEMLVKTGASRTLNSRHLTGHAVDLAPILQGEVRWDWPLFYHISDAMHRAADEEAVHIIWGGTWRKFKDGPHFELPRQAYPDPMR